MRQTDYLPFIKRPIIQDAHIYHANSDTALLGHSLDFKKDLSVLDIGTNTGALLIYASKLEPKDLMGIDVNEEALKLALENLKLNGIEAKLLHSSLNDFKHEPFDVIVTNPPFLQSDARRQRFKEAMDQTMLPLDDLFRGFKRLIKDNGTIYMIYAAEYLEDIMIKAHEAKFKIMSIRPVYDVNKNEATRVILKLKKGHHTKTKVLKPYLIKKGEILADI